MKKAQKITPFLWFDGNAEEAVRFYTSVFEDSKILEVARYTDAGPGPAGSVMTVRFRLAGQEFVALNGGPEFKFTEAISLAVRCDTQAEVDELWAGLGAGGEHGQCGWLKDRFGLSWQVVPSVVPALVSDPDPAKAKRVIEAIMTMRKLDIAALQRAHSGR